MRRKTLDLLLNWVGVLLTAVFLVAGIGMLIGYSFTSSQVKSQLVEQKVFFPTKTQMDYRDLVAAHETQYAGQEVLAGSQAQIFANDIIGVDTAAIERRQDLRSLECRIARGPLQHLTRRSGATRLSRRHPAGPVAQRLRLRFHGSHRALRSNWHVHRSPHHVVPHPPRCAPLPQDRRDRYGLRKLADQEKLPGSRPGVFLYGTSVDSVTSGDVDHNFSSRLVRADTTSKCSDRGVGLVECESVRNEKRWFEFSGIHHLHDLRPGFAGVAEAPLHDLVAVDEILGRERNGRSVRGEPEQYDHRPTGCQGERTLRRRTGPGRFDDEIEALIGSAVTNESAPAFIAKVRCASLDQ